MKFKGTIIITDPCYIIKDRTEDKDDWEDCDYGENMKVLGIKTYFTENTIYGDWSCTTYKDDNPEVIVNQFSEALSKDDYDTCDSILGKCSKLGEFCADAGLVSVFLLDEVRKYNPDIDKWIEEHPWCVTTIPDFDGDVDTLIDENGDLHVIGKGNVNFITIQTGA